MAFMFRNQSGVAAIHALFAAASFGVQRRPNLLPEQLAKTSSIVQRDVPGLPGAAGSKLAKRWAKGFRIRGY